MSLDKEVAIFCLNLSQAAYTKRYARLDCTNIEEFSDADTDTEGFLGLATDQTLVIAFTGSESTKDWLNNLKFLRTPYPSTNTSQKIKMHSGFYAGYLSVRQFLHNVVTERQPEKLLVTGHSLGGGLATLCALDLQYNFFPDNPTYPDQVICYTFGAPKVGNRAFSISYNARVPHTFRIINGGDGVPWLPRPWQGYNHTEKLYRIGGSLLLRIVSFAAVRDHLIPAYRASLNAL